MMLGNHGIDMWSSFSRSKDGSALGEEMSILIAMRIGLTLVLANPNRRRPVHRAARPPLQLGVNRHVAAGVQDPHGVGADHDAHPFADQPPRQRIGVATDLDGTVSANLPQRIARAHERRDASRWPQCRRLVAREPHRRHLGGRTMQTLINDLS